VLADTGIRVGELVNLTVNDILERDRSHYLRVGGKTGERMVPIPRLYPATAPPRPAWPAARRAARERGAGQSVDL